MKNLIIKNIVIFTSTLLLVAFNIGCVDSLNAPYPGGILNDNPSDSVVEQINPPTDLKINEFKEGSVFGLWWYDNSGNEDGFEIWRKDGSENYKQIKILPSNSSAYNDTITNKNLTYSFKIRAFKNGYFSNFSNEVNTVQDISLVTPSELTGEVITSATNVILNWKDNSSNELGIIIERKMTDEFEFIEIGRVGPNSVSWTDTSHKLQIGLTAYYRVSAYNTIEQSNHSNIISITL